MKINYDNIEIEIKQVKPTAFKTTLDFSKEEQMLVSWKNYIYNTIYTRLCSCKTSLLNNISRIYYSDDVSTYYCSTNGIDKHYSIPAAKAMEDILEYINADEIEKILLREDCIVQLLKALYVIPQSSIREEKIDGTDFYSLIDMLFINLEKLRLKSLCSAKINSI